jgi:hypothetical protein
VTGSPVIGPVTCVSGGGGNKVGVIPGAGPGYVFNSDGSSCYGQEPGPDGDVDKALASDGGDLSTTGPKYDTPVVPAVGHPAFARMDPLGQSVTFLAPAAGLIRATDLVFPEYQGGQDFLVAWNANSGAIAPGWPAVVNDLQFLTGPSVGDLDGLPGQEAVGGSANLDLDAVDAAGQPVPGFPKLSSDWMVTNPVIGSFGALETDANTHNVVGAMTRRGTLFVYDTPAPACPLGSWPRFHHDNANSGTLDRDAVSPGAVSGAKVLGTSLVFTAPGDDLLCGKVHHYEVVTSDVPVNGTAFGGAAQITPAAAQLAAPGASQTLNLAFALRRYVAVRAVDDQGNAGRLALVDRAPGSNPGGGNPPPGGGNPPPGGGNPPPGGGNPSGCRDRRSPVTTLSRRALHRSRAGFSGRGHSRDTGCAGLRRVEFSIARLQGRKCRFVRSSRRATLTGRRSCSRPVWLRARGRSRWSFKLRGRVRPGTYRILVRAIDRKGNRERVRRAGTMRFRVR